MWQGAEGETHGSILVTMEFEIAVQGGRCIRIGDTRHRVN